MGNTNNGNHWGRQLVVLLLIWAVVGALIVLPNQDTITQETRIFLLWPIFLFIAPPGWAVLAIIHRLGSNKIASDYDESPPNSSALHTFVPSRESVDHPEEKLDTPLTFQNIANATDTPVSRVQNPTNGPRSVVHSSDTSLTRHLNISRPGAEFDQLMDQGSRRALADLHQWICQLCLEKIPDVVWDFQNVDSRRLSIDHIIPRSKGGTDEITNLQPVHSYCNSTKGGRNISNLEFRQEREIRLLNYKSQEHQSRLNVEGNRSQVSNSAKSSETSSWLPAPRPGEWRSPESVIQRLLRQLNQSQLSSEQKRRAQLFLQSSHPHELLWTCQRGHDLTLDNTYFRIEETGTIGRQCRVCRR